MYKIDWSMTERTVALVAKVPKSGRSCNTLRDSLEAARENKKERPREALRSVRKRNRAREENEAYKTRARARRSGSPSNYVNKTFCSRFWECGRAGPPTEEKGYLPPLSSGPGF